MTPDSNKIIFPKRENFEKGGVEFGRVVIRLFQHEKHVEARYNVGVSYPADMSDEAKANFVFQRAKRMLFRRMVALEADHMVTLTYRENLQDLEISKKHVSQFCKEVRRLIPEWRYVAVAEYQQRGAVHWHLGVKGYQNVTLLRTVWLKVIGDGNINVKHFKGRSAPDIARYISKYLGKEFEDTGDRVKWGAHYKCSRGLGICEETYELYGCTADQVEEWLRDEFKRRGSRIKSQFFTRPHKYLGGAAS